MTKTYKIQKDGVIKIVNGSELEKYIALGWKEIKDIVSINNQSKFNFSK